MIKIDTEFQSLIPPLTADEYKQLEENCVRDGIREPLVVWPQEDGTDILVDGHNRWNISTHHGGIMFGIKRIEFSDRNEAKRWIILNQFGRRNLSAYDRSLLALKLKPVIAEQAKANQIRTSENRVSQKSDEQRISTKDELARVAGVSHDTIHRVEVIEKKATPEIKQQVRSGEKSINKAFNEVVKKPHVANNSTDNEWYTPERYIEAARLVMGTIDLDPASNDFANLTVKASQYYTEEMDGLSREWFGNIWMNPPYSTALLQRFAEKLASSKFNQAIVLVNNATETGWFETLVKKASAIVFHKGRIRFVKRDGEHGSPLQGQAFLYFGDKPDRFLEVFKDFGWGVKT